MEYFDKDSSSSGSDGTEQASDVPSSAAMMAGSAGENLSSSPQPRQRRPIAIVAHNSQWPAIYEAEKQRIMAAFHSAGFSGHVVAVEHVGSTSVPGLGAKPVVDLMIGVVGQADLDVFPATVFTELGYVHRPFSAPKSSGPAAPRLLFSKYATPATNVHAFIYGGAHWKGHLAVRDYLRTHPKQAATYVHLKQVFARQHANDLAAYGRAKRPFLDSLEQVALGKPSTRIWPGRRTTKHAQMSIRTAPTPLLDSPGTGGGYGGSGSGTEGSGSGRSSGSPPASQGPVYLGDPTGWQLGVWYIDQYPNGWFVSPDQDPRAGDTLGVFANFDGQNGWTICGIGEASETELNDNQMDISQDEPAEYQVYPTTVVRPDGTSYTEVFLPPGYSNFDPPPNAIAILEDDGTTTIVWNNDGSPWTDGTGSSGSGDGSGSDGSGGDGSSSGGDDFGDGSGDDEEPNPY